VVAVFRFRDVEPGITQHFRQQQTNFHFILDDEDALD